MESYRKNAILARLDDDDADTVMSNCKLVDLVAGSEIATAGEGISTMLFPLEGVVSIVANYTDGSFVEMATVGREGFTGLEAVLGGNMFRTGQLVQIPGRAIQINRSNLTKLMANNAQFRNLLFVYSRDFLYQTMVSVACNAVHLAGQRLARWLLMMLDRMDLNEMTFSHDFLAEMIGVRRATITESIRKLVDTGAIENPRGRIVVRDRNRLQRHACECYDLTRMRTDIHPVRR